MDVMDLNKLDALLEDVGNLFSEIEDLVYDRAPEELEHAVFLMVQAWGEVICVVDDLGRNPQDIQKGERDE